MGMAIPLATDERTSVRLSTVVPAPSLGPAPQPAVSGADAARRVDETLMHTFPASDPPAWWAGPAD